MELSVVIPCYNEEKRIQTTLGRIIPFLERNTSAYEIILVDDGSTDKTLSVARTFIRAPIRILRNKRNMGKGYSVQQGMLAAKYSWVLFSDADLSTPIEELNKLRKYRDTHEIIIGSRAVPGSVIVESQPFYRVALGKTFNKIVQALAVPGIYDTQCGFKLFSAKAARDIFSKQTLTGFSFDAETLYIAQHIGYAIKEVPITWKNSKESKVNTLTEPFAMLRDLITMRIDHSGKNYLEKKEKERNNSPIKKK